MLLSLKFLKKYQNLLSYTDKVENDHWLMIQCTNESVPVSKNFEVKQGTLATGRSNHSIKFVFLPKNSKFIATTQTATQEVN